MKMLFTLIVAGGALGVSCAGAVAQSPGGASLVGQTRASAGCPAVGLHIIREGSQLSGVVFNLDGSGTSKVSGTTDGKTFSWHDTPVNGNGPTGDVSGTVSPQGVFRSAKAGTPCTFDTLLPLLNEYGGRRRLATRTGRVSCMAGPPMHEPSPGLGTSDARHSL